MSGFLEKMAENFLGGGNRHQQQEYGGNQGYGGQNYGGQNYGGPGPQGSYGQQQQQPQPPYPWVARWDDRENRTIYINEQTGERTHQFPGGYGGGQGNYGGGYGGPQQSEHGRNEYAQQEHKKKSGHGLAYGVGGAALGLAGGALLMHEGEEMKQDWDGDKRRWENDAENFPDDAAQWTGRKVGEVEAIPQDVEQGFDRFGDRVERKWDNAVDDVEDAPEDVANWVGDKVGDVERFGDNVDDAYDAGRDEGRYGDDDNY